MKRKEDEFIKKKQTVAINDGDGFAGNHYSAGFNSKSNNRSNPQPSSTVCGKCDSNKVYAHWCSNLGKPINTITTFPQLPQQPPCANTVQPLHIISTASIQCSQYGESPIHVRFPNPNHS